MSVRTSGSLVISLSPSIPGIPGIPHPIPGILPGKLPGVAQGKPPEIAMLSSSLSSDFLLLGSFLFLPSLLNPLHFFFEPLVFTVSVRLSLLSSSFLGPWLKFFKHYTNIFIVIELTGKGRTMDCFYPVAQRYMCFPAHL